MSATDNRKKAYIRDYLSDSGIKANSKGYKALYYAILEAVEHPGYSCSELFEKAAEKLSAENKDAVTGHVAYRNAQYAIKNSMNGGYVGGPYTFIKSCSVKLEIM